MNLHGFNITNTKKLGDAKVIMMHHEKTGAGLVWFNNKEENKLFSISFKTVPEDDTGVFHILEHSVLGGSEHYPVKEPFLYMLKSSMNTFLNAMTFPDKTMFPISSRNNADFMNLAKVYLDAVFKPEIYTNPNIFYQEGHHIEYRADGDIPAYKGVVFNEMKGVVSSVHECMESEIMAMLFPETCYRFEYGGLPSAIPNLTYRQFIDTHKRYYHPSNSYIWLDGDIDIESVLELIDGYLSEYNKSDCLPEIPMQIPVNSDKTRYYEIAPDESEEKQTHIAVGKILASWQEREKVFAYSILCEALAASNDSPFKRAMLDTGLCLDVELSLSDDVAQPFGILRINNIVTDDKDKILSAVKDIVSGIVRNGIGHEILSASINREEFNFLEGEEPQGLTRCIDAMASWLYGGDPLLYIDCQSVFESLREKIDTGYFEKLLSDWLLDENGRAILCMIPSGTYGDEQKRQEQERLDNELANMSAEEKAELIRLNNALDKWQKNPDSAEDIAKIPVLPLSEVSNNPIDYKIRESSLNGVTILNHPAKNKGIVSVNLWFDVSDFSRAELETLSLIDKLVSKLPTKKYSGIELTQQIVDVLGHLSTDISAFSKPESPEKCRVYFSVKSRFLARNCNSAQALIAEILTATIYDNVEIISEIISQDKEELRQDIIADGHRFAMRRARSTMSAESAVAELINGFESYEFIREIDDNRIREIISDITRISERVFCRARLTASITSAESVSLESLVNALPDGEKMQFAELSLSELGMESAEAQGIIIPSGVSYSGAVLAEKTCDKALWDVLSTLMTYEYLWNEIRVKGGAYGTGSGTNSLGETAFYSFRDPSPDLSLDVYVKSADFLKEYCAENPDITQYIISTIARGEPLISDSEYGTTADIFYFRGIDFEERRNIRKRILSMTYSDLLSAVPYLENQGIYCVIGSKETVEGLLVRNADLKIMNV